MNFLSRILSQHVIKIHDGRASCTKGKMLGTRLAEISSLAAQHSISKGEIWIDSQGKIHFSRHIPAELHQRLRNMIASR
jgi:hypothetical protein